VTFLDPWTIAVAAGLTIPPLVALYFLKLRRQVKLVSSTFLWRRAVEDLHVNAPFQRLRRSLLLLLQLLVLILAAIALGKPIWQQQETAESTLILLIDQSASMSVIEEDGRSRLDIAKEQAKNVVANMSDESRAMVIAFCDRGTVVSSFDQDKKALQRKIDSIEQTDSTSTLAEAIALAEAYGQNVIIGGEQAGTDIAPESAAPAAAVFLFTDGRIEDGRDISPQRLDVARMKVARVGARDDNVGITAMEARRDYERPEFLEVVAAVQNFSAQAVTVDASLYIDGRAVDVQTVALDAGRSAAAEPDTPGASTGSARLAVFDDIQFEGGGIVEVVLSLDDALSADDRAWTILDPPRRIRVLLVSAGNDFLQGVLRTLSVQLTAMTPAEYEAAEPDKIADGPRSVFDVVILDRHSTARLPQGNYFFWGGVPMLEGVAAGAAIEDEVIFNWDETHPVLRHIAVETLDVARWSRLSLPADATSLIDGQTSPVLAYLTRDASQFLISAFSLIVMDDGGLPRMNTDWVATVDFVVFVQNAVQYLASNIAATGARSVPPGEPVTVPVATDERGRPREAVVIVRPDRVRDEMPTGGAQSVHYARTRTVGAYRVEGAAAGREVFAVNLFNAVESDVAPVENMALGADGATAQASAVQVTRPAWPYLLLAILVLLILEWIVYNRRVLV
jgi:hypothetical protein